MNGGLASIGSVKVSGGDFAMVRWLLRVILHPGWAPLAVVVLHLVLAHFGLTERFDHLLHYLGGVSITYFLFGIILSLPKYLDGPVAWAKYLLAFTGGCTVAVFWEFAEFASDTFLRTTIQRGIAETMLDLLFGVTGAASVLLLIAMLRKVGNSKFQTAKKIQDEESRH